MKNKLSSISVNEKGFLTNTKDPKTDNTLVIVCPDNSSPQLKLAAKELRRYIYLRTGKLLRISSKKATQSITLIIDSKLQTQEYSLKSTGESLVISGGSGVAVLYGAYGFVEKLGVRFYLHGDVVPDGKISLHIPQLNETQKPFFELRGIQPFHDFPDGPDWWNQDDYLAYIGQLAKMRMNFIGLHCYPYRKDNVPKKGDMMIGPEPLVWFGLPQDINPDGTVKSSYPTWWDNTARDSGWPYGSLKTSEFTNGSAQLFPTDIYGPDVMEGMMPLPKTAEESNELFNRVGKQMGIVFAEAKKVGVKTCIGSETPFIMPPALAEHLKQLGKDPKAPETIAEVYEGAFQRIAKVMPADYYWLWTSEGDLHKNPEGVKRDLLIAYNALKKISPSVPLATCGWGFNPAYDAFLPKDSPMSGISAEFGHYSLSPALADIQGRPKWAIPWFENDVNLAGYQPWVGRLRQDAVDARRFGANGLMGLHWHVKSMMNNIAALAQAGWDQSYVAKNFNIVPVSSGKGLNVLKETRMMPIDDYYEDFAKANFGSNKAKETGGILAESEKMQTSLKGTAHRPDPTGWGTFWGAQGALQSDPEMHAYAQKNGELAERFAKLRQNIKGAGNLERFDYWLTMLRIQTAMYEAGAVHGKLRVIVAEMEKENDPVKKKDLASKAIIIRAEVVRAWDKIMQLEIISASTPGDLGLIANLERNSRIWDNWLNRFDTTIEKVTGKPMPADCAPSMNYTGPATIKVFTVRSSLHRGEVLELRPVVLSAEQSSSVIVKWRKLGEKNWQQSSAVNVGRSVWTVKLPTATEDFEYHIIANGANDQKLIWPATAPMQNQTVIVTE
ncbi:hypothetical protein [Flavobacterium gilvum]|uniref:Alpha glucuronidase N-terminal domain-containing protein n=1 Tax=Flavobacterium gilvum TaxID=1492737 RepID=A0AAC9I414_9FLAO|nr:hypothetical protein [Flavobacterium gilvum]AOW09964.1 hypothetical protein EM308_10835 [Flavobacterium gilvum]KFC59023.1 hypothetical protein FEM08_22110 [Flavobacterium gilvum]